MWKPSKPRYWNWNQTWLFPDLPHQWLTLAGGAPLRAKMPQCSPSFQDWPRNWTPWRRATQKLQPWKPATSQPINSQPQSGSENVTETGCKPIATPNPMGKKRSTTQQIWGVFHPRIIEIRWYGIHPRSRPLSFFFVTFLPCFFPGVSMWFPLEFVTKRGTPLLRDFSSSSTEGSINLSSCRDVVFGIGCGGGVHKFVGEVSEVMASKWEKHDFTNGGWVKTLVPSEPQNSW